MCTLWTRSLRVFYGSLSYMVSVSWQLHTRQTSREISTSFLGRYAIQSFHGALGVKKLRMNSKSGTRLLLEVYLSRRGSDFLTALSFNAQDVMYSDSALMMAWFADSL